MSGLTSIAHLSAQTWLGIGAVVVLVGLLLAVRASRQRNIVVSSATADMISYHLSRIADALDRGALEQVGSRAPLRRDEPPAEPVRKPEPRVVEPRPAPQAHEPRPVGLSMFGR
jgi:hypothetical protein